MSKELETVVNEWGREIVEYYRWEEIATTTKKHLDNIASQVSWTKARDILNDVMLERHLRHDNGNRSVRAIGDHDRKSNVKEKNLPIEASDVTRALLFIQSSAGKGSAHGNDPLGDDGSWLKKMREEQDFRAKLRDRCIEDRTLQHDKYGLLVPGPKQLNNQERPNQATPNGSNNPNGARPTVDTPQNHERSERTMPGGSNKSSNLIQRPTPPQQRNRIGNLRNEHANQIQSEAFDQSSLLRALDVFIPSRAEWSVGSVDLDQGGTIPNEAEKSRFALVVHSDGSHYIAIVVFGERPSTFIHYTPSQLDRLPPLIQRLNATQHLAECEFMQRSKMSVCVAAAIYQMHGLSAPEEIIAPPWDVALAPTQKALEPPANPSTPTPSTSNAPLGLLQDPAVLENIMVGGGTDPNPNPVDSSPSEYFTDETFGDFIQTCLRIDKFIGDARKDTVNYLQVALDAFKQKAEEEGRRLQSDAQNSHGSPLICARPVTVPATELDSKHYKQLSNNVSAAIQNLLTTTKSQISKKVEKLDNERKRWMKYEEKVDLLIYKKKARPSEGVTDISG